MAGTGELRSPQPARIVGRDAALARLRGLLDPVLASEGLTNAQIGDRLFLSPRTVSSHLYRSFPKLGVADRHQLRDVIGRDNTSATARERAGSEPPA